MSNIIEVYPAAGKTVRAAPVWQYDYGQTLHAARNQWEQNGQTEIGPDFVSVTT